MNGETRYRALFLGAGPLMHCGVGQFSRLLQETIEKLEPGTSATLTLTRSEGSLAETWRAIGTAQSVVCNFPIVAWKRVMFAPLAAVAIARLRRRKVVLIQHEWSGLHWLRRITYMPALLLADTIVMFSPLVRQELAADPDGPGVYGVVFRGRRYDTGDRVDYIKAIVQLAADREDLGPELRPWFKEFAATL